MTTREAPNTSGMFLVGPLPLRPPLLYKDVDFWKL